MARQQIPKNYLASPLSRSGGPRLLLCDLPVPNATSICAHAQLQLHSAWHWLLQVPRLLPWGTVSTGEQVPMSQSTPFSIFYLSPNTGLEFSCIHCLMEQVTCRYTRQPAQTAVEAGTFNKGNGVDRWTWKHLKQQQNDKLETGQPDSLLDIKSRGGDYQPA